MVECFLSGVGVWWFCMVDGGEFVDGIFEVIGCCDVVFILGGVKVVFVVVECVLCELLGFGDVIVVVVFDECWGEVLVVVMVFEFGVDGVSDVDVVVVVVCEFGIFVCFVCVVYVLVLLLLLSGKVDCFVV